jgi:hypothetical protein
MEYVITGYMIWGEIYKNLRRKKREFISKYERGESNFYFILIINN